MGVALRVVEWLRVEGHDVVHLREENLHTLPDPKIFEKAISDRRVLLTFDLDFGEVVGLSGTRSPGVVIFRLRNTTTPHVIARLRNVLEQSSKDLGDGAIVVVEETRHRVRRPSWRQ
jgi:predicted nuclease of predicted toxin-antitoxin system